MGIWEVFGRQLRLTILDKVLFPAADGQPPVTNRELIRYAACMAPVVLPYLAGRALIGHRHWLADLLGADYRVPGRVSGDRTWPIWWVRG